MAAKRPFSVCRRYKARGERRNSGKRVAFDSSLENSARGWWWMRVSTVLWMSLAGRIFT